MARVDHNDIVLVPLDDKNFKENDFIPLVSFIKEKHDENQISQNSSSKLQDFGTSNESSVAFQNLELSRPKFFIESNHTAEDKKPWLVIKSIRNELKQPIGYELQKSDIIKLGRMELRVRDIQTESIQKSDPQDPRLHKNVGEMKWIKNDLSQPTDSEDVSSNIKCRICLDDSYSEERPLIHCCKCNGSVKYMHLDCLQMWLKSQSKSATNFKLQDWLESYSWKRFAWELWKQPYPYSLKSEEGKYHDLYNFDIPDGPFIILEQITNYSCSQELTEGQNKSSKVVCIIKPNHNDNEFQIGRNQDSGLRVSDISVSRKHCVIQYKDGKFMLFDSGAKFGTLVQVKNNKIEVQFL